MVDEWFRRKTWTPKDREEFFSRLRRSRGAYHKAQYTWIQAYTLMATGTRESYLVALELVDMVLSEWHEDVDLASVYNVKAGCHVGLGDLPRTIDAYRKVFQTQRTRKKYRTNAHLDFGWLVATTPLPEFYDEALPLLDEFRSDLFPIDRYRSNAIRALIFNARGQFQQAKDYAQIALQEAEAKHSGFRYHAKVGLVESPSDKVQMQLRALAS